MFPYFRVCRSEDEVLAAIDEIEVGRKTIDVLTDGAVIKVNDAAVREAMGYTDKFPRWAMAFKFEAEEVTTKVEDVVWQVGRTGKLTPLALLDPVELAGATVRKATLNNYGDILRKDVKIGSRVLIRRSNEVIPEILGATEHSEDSREIEKPTVCPACGSPLNGDGRQSVLPQPGLPSPHRRQARPLRGQERDGHRGFSESTAYLLIDKKGVRNFSDLYRLTRGSDRSRGIRAEKNLQSAFGDRKEQDGAAGRLYLRHRHRRHRQGGRERSRQALQEHGRAEKGG